jgi:hypothetical protein
MSSAAISGSTRTGRLAGSFPGGTADLRGDYFPVTDARIGRPLIAP